MWMHSLNAADRYQVRGGLNSLVQYWKRTPFANNSLLMNDCLCGLMVLRSPRKGADRGSNSAFPVGLFRG